VLGVRDSTLRGKLSGSFVLPIRITSLDLRQEIAVFGQ
jgi:hypothetical protein